MRWFRNRLPWLAAGWLIGELVVFVVAPVALGRTDFAAGLGGCDCPDALPGAFCPMHGSSSANRAPEGNCTMRSTCSPSDAALLSLGLGMGILPSAAVGQAELQIDLTPVLSVAPFGLSEFPDSPPPRA